MHKGIEIIAEGHLVPLGPDMMVRRVIPNHYIQSVGPFVFLDHLGPVQQAPDLHSSKKGTGAHPHRGIITFTYLLDGEVEHRDSRGNYSKVKAGGAQWMKAGNGIIHDEGPSLAFQQQGGILHGIQLWINLPAANKAEDPEYVALQKEEVPEIILPGNIGRLRLLMGTYQGVSSSLKTYSPLLNYHVQLHSLAKFSLNCIADFEYGVYLLSGEVEIGGKLLKGGEFASISAQGDVFEIKNIGEEMIDVLVYGGKALHEPMVAEGPFVMNDKIGIATAYRDFYNGKYGDIGN